MLEPAPLPILATRATTGYATARLMLASMVIVILGLTLTYAEGRAEVRDAATAATEMIQAVAQGQMPVHKAHGSGPCG
jgi:hypothetical protein